MIENIIASIIGAVIIAVVVRLYMGVMKFPGFKKSFRVMKDFCVCGGINYFPDRSAYHIHKDHGTAAEYLLRETSHDIIYVGFSLAQSSVIGSIVDCLAELANSGHSVKIVLFNPESQYRFAVASYLGINEEQLLSGINETINKLKKARREKVSHDNKCNFTVLIHDVAITTSAFIINGSVPKSGKILLDHKLYGIARESTYGIELWNNGGNLYNNAYKSYMKIANEARQIVGE